MRRTALAVALLMAGIAAPAAANSPRAAARYLVIIVLDGARPSYLTFSGLPNINRLMRHGVVFDRAFVGQLTANTPPSHATIGTGVFPRRHGIEGFWWEDPVTHRMIRPTDNSAVLNGSLSRILSAHHVPSIAAELRSVDRRARSVAVAAHKCYAAEAMGTGASDYLLCALIYHGKWVAQAVRGHTPPPGAINNPTWDRAIPPATSGIAPAVEQWNLAGENHWTMQYAEWAFTRVHYPRLLMINLAETDVMGHFSGANQNLMRTLMQGFDADLGHLVQGYRRAGILGQTTFVLTSDHGMSRVDTRMPFEVLDRSIALAGAKKVFLEADTSAVLGVTPLSRARDVASNVSILGGRRVDAAYFKVNDADGWHYRLARSAPGLAPALLRAYSDLAATDASADGPDVLVFYAPHVTTGDRIVDGFHWLAGHLGAGWDEQHIPLVLSGAGVRRGAVSHFPARLVDIAPTVEYLLGDSRCGCDGIPLADALSDSTKNLRRQEKDREARLSADVRALQERSGS